MSNFTLSIIVPCYNSSLYLEETLQSVLSQSFSDFEVIIIDDCSNDSTKDIILKYAKIDKRIKAFFNEKNEGVSFSRNFGFSKSSGEYIIFLDSDDYFATNDAFQKIVDAIDPECDLISFPFKLNDSEHIFGRFLKYDGDKHNFNDESSCLRNLFSGYYFYFPCNKVYKASIIRKYKISFPCDFRVSEDLCFNTSYFCYVKSLKLISLPALYIYRIHSDSTYHSFKNKDYEFKINNHIQACKYISNDISNRLDINQHHNIFLYLLFYKRYVPISKNYFIFLKLLRKNGFQSIKINKNIGLSSPDYIFAKSCYSIIYRYTFFICFCFVKKIEKLLRK